MGSAIIYRNDELWTQFITIYKTAYETKVNFHINLFMRNLWKKKFQIRTKTYKLRDQVFKTKTIFVISK